MILRELFLTEARQQPDILQAFKDFLPLAMQELKISKLPRIRLKKHMPEGDQPTFGQFVKSENTIYLGIDSRHPVDTLRTLAHELVHFKQFIQHELNNKSGETGSPQENQAHELAGVVMRRFNKQYPEYFKYSALNIDEYKSNEPEQDPGNPIPYPAGTVKVDVSDVYDWYKLGQKISDLGDAKPSDFGKGPPQTVMAFGNEPEEHRYFKALKRLGLKTHDIDPPGYKDKD